jgi:hypothetical protein
MDSPRHTAFQTGKLERALELIGKAIPLNPGNAQAFNDPGVMVAGLGNNGEALARHDWAIPRQAARATLGAIACRAASSTGPVTTSRARPRVSQ